MHETIGQYFYSKYVRSYIHLAVCTSLLVSFSYQATATGTNWQYSLWAGLSVCLLYRYHDILPHGYRQWKAVLKQHFILTLILLAGMAGGLVFFSADWTMLLSYLVAALICFAYFVPVLPGNKMLRDHYIGKPVVIGLVFAILTAFYPYMQTGYSVSESIFLSLGRWSFIMALALLFDIGDVTQDALSPTTTLPQKRGIPFTKMTAYALLFFAAAAEGYGTWLYLIEFPALMSLLITYFLTGLLILFSGTKRNEAYYLILADGMLALPWFFSFI